MRHTITIFIILLLGAGTLRAQDGNFLDKGWKVKEYSATLQGNKRTLFHVDSAINFIDYAALRLWFSDSSNYVLKQGTATDTGQWVLNAGGDSLLMDGVGEQLIWTDESNFTLIRYELQFVDLEGNLDTVFYSLSFVDTLAGVTDRLAATDKMRDERLSDEPVKGMVIAYPNPAKGALKLELRLPPGAGVVKQINLINISGQVMKTVLPSRKRKIVEMDVHDLPPGLYIVDVLDTANNRIARTRVIKE